MPLAVPVPRQSVMCFLLLALLSLVHVTGVAAAAPVLPLFAPDRPALAPFPSAAAAVTAAVGHCAGSSVFLSADGSIYSLARSPSDDSSQWSALGRIPAFARSDFGALVLPDRSVMVLGGHIASGELTQDVIYSSGPLCSSNGTASPPSSVSWLAAPVPAWRGRDGFALVVWGSTVLVLGGRVVDAQGDVVKTNGIWSIPLSSAQSAAWTQVNAPDWAPRSHFVAQVLPGYGLVVAAGEGDRGSRFNDVWLLPSLSVAGAPHSNGDVGWLSLVAAPFTPRSHGASLVWNASELVVACGLTTSATAAGEPSSEIYIFAPSSGWTRVPWTPPALTARASPALVTLGQRLIIAAGVGADGVGRKEVFVSRGYSEGQPEFPSPSADGGGSTAAAAGGGASSPSSSYVSSNQRLFSPGGAHCAGGCGLAVGLVVGLGLGLCILGVLVSAVREKRRRDEKAKATLESCFSNITTFVRGGGAEAPSSKQRPLVEGPVAFAGSYRGSGVNHEAESVAFEGALTNQKDDLEWTSSSQDKWGAFSVRGAASLRGGRVGCVKQYSGSLVEYTGELHTTQAGRVMWAGKWQLIGEHDSGTFEFEALQPGSTFWVQRQSSQQQQKSQQHKTASGHASPHALASPSSSPKPFDGVVTGQHRVTIHHHDDREDSEQR